MKPTAMLLAAATLLATTCAGTVLAAPADTAAPASPGSGGDGKVERYLERRGQSTERQMEDVMEPMKRGEGIRGATELKGKPIHRGYSSSRGRQ